MISNNTSFINAVKLTDRSVVVSACSLGFSASPLGTGVSGFFTEMPLAPLGGFPVLEPVERRTKALEAGVAAAEAKAYAFAAASAGNPKQTQHHTKWAFRGLKPWSHPA
ncbi:hypothetical protein [Streptomyces albipurpureus]|uniref:Uncharacterized protein n=1 Tax=Streptomyces albipurpureus TaxID=2897419 RepID=A0ABT0UK93_9ACTN|nr:hypothetical protein [Streptomyces sp. CWNU-1]MCM2389037.1 hypothetical protein [Streptomyces sp. CWNU-1]